MARKDGAVTILLIVLIVALFALAISQPRSLIGSATSFTTCAQTGSCGYRTNAESNPPPPPPPPPAPSPGTPVQVPGNPTQPKPPPSTPPSVTHRPCTPEEIEALGEVALFFCD